MGSHKSHAFQFKITNYEQTSSSKSLLLFDVTVTQFDSWLIDYLVELRHTDVKLLTLDGASTFVATVILKTN